MIKIDLKPYQLEFKKPFRIAHGSRTHTDSVFVRLTYNGTQGFGEATLPPYLNETTDSVIQFFEGLEFPLPPVRENLKGLLKHLDTHKAGNSSAKAAASMAIFDLSARLENKSVADFLGIELHSASTSYTISISDEDELEKELAGGIPAPMIKVKLGGKNDMEMIRTIRKFTNVPGWVDINQGWKDHIYALEMSEMLKENGFLFIEQPFPVNRTELTEWLFQRGPLPVFADESCQDASDLHLVSRIFDGINIKLMKAGGIHQALDIFEKAREKKLSILLGGMAESSCAAAAALQLASLADFVDLDGPLLIKNDPFSGLVYKDGVMMPDGKAGIGVDPQILF